MEQASYLPLVVMVLASLCGADEDLSVTVVLSSIMVLLVALGALAGRRAGVTGWPLGLVTLAPLALLHGTAPLVPVEQHFAPPIRIARS